MIGKWLTQMGKSVKPDLNAGQEAVWSGFTGILFVSQVFCE